EHSGEVPHASGNALQRQVGAFERVQEIPSCVFSWCADKELSAFQDCWLLWKAGTHRPSCRRCKPCQRATRTAVCQRAPSGFRVKRMSSTFGAKLFSESKRRRGCARSLVVAVACRESDQTRATT